MAMRCLRGAASPRAMQLTRAKQFLELLLLGVAAATATAVQEDANMCSTWASNGECDSNPQYMLENCPAACARSEPGQKSQLQRECAGYADMGECSRNPAFMLSACRRECDAWEARTGLKIDRDSKCVEWSILGKCESHATEMATTCNTSCTVRQRCLRSNFTGWSIGVCDKALRCEAQDTRSGCDALAAAGACRSDPTSMARA